MKKTLLTLSLCCLAGVSMAARPEFVKQEAPGAPDGTSSFDFCYCGSLHTTVPYPAGMEVSGAMYMPEEKVTEYAGCKITAVNVFVAYDDQTMQNSIKKAKVWLSYDLNEEPFYSQEGALDSRILQYQSITLDEPYVIKSNQPLYIGYTVESPGEMQGSITWDMVQHDNDWGGWAKLPVTDDEGNPATDENGALVESRWINYTSSNGFVLIKATLEGSGLPQNAVSVYSSSSWNFAYPGDDNMTRLVLLSEGVQQVESVGLEVTVGDAEPLTATMNLDDEEDIFYNDIFAVTVDYQMLAQGINVPVRFRITEVNGKPNESAGGEYTDYVLCMPKGSGFERNVVMEQGTSLAQGGSIRGIVSNELMTAQYGADDTFVPVMVHMYDEASPVGYNAFFEDRLCTTVPSVIPNRLTEFANSSVDIDSYEQLYERVRAIPAIARMDAEVLFEDESDKTLLTVNTVTEFCDDASGEWRLAYVLRRNQVGPYAQANAFSGQDVEMGGFESDKEVVNIMLDNVAVLIEDYNGVVASQMEDVKAGEKYMYSYPLHIDTDKDLKYTSVVIYLINNLNGAIENVTVVPGGRFGISSADISEADRVEVFGVTGGIEIRGEFAHAEIYDFSGHRVAGTSTSGMLALPAGLYVVSVDGTASKVIVN